MLSPGQEEVTCGHFTHESAVQYHEVQCGLVGASFTATQPSVGYRGSSIETRAQAPHAVCTLLGLRWFTLGGLSRWVFRRRSRKDQGASLARAGGGVHSAVRWLLFQPKVIGVLQNHSFLDSLPSYLVCFQAGSRSTGPRLGWVPGRPGSVGTEPGGSALLWEWRTLRAPCWQRLPWWQQTYWDLSALHKYL